MSSRGNPYRRILRHPDIFGASLRYHVRKVVTRPIRTALSIVVAYVLFVLLITIASDPEGLSAAADSGVSVATILPLLPPASVLVLIAVLTIIAVPVGTVTSGVRRDLKFRRRRN